MHYVYILTNPDNALYVGITQNPQQRLQKHNTGRGAQFTKTTKNFEIVFLEDYSTLKVA